MLDGWYWVASQLIVGAAVWGGIRVDIKNIHARLSASESAQAEAHRRHDANALALARRVDEILLDRK